MHKTDDPTLPPPAVLDALRDGYHHPLTEAEIAALWDTPDTETARAAKAYLARMAEVPRGDHAPPAPLLRALRRPRSLQQRIARLKAAQKAC
jgi:hypothetical protein